MTIQKTHLQSEFLQTISFYKENIVRSEQSNSETNIFYLRVKPQETLVKNSISLDDVFAELMQDEKAADLLVDANKRIAEHFYNGERSLRAMRLSKGLTQCQLANAIGTSQPQINKLESGKHDVLSSTVIKLAKFFELSRGEMFEIITGDLNEA